MIKTNDDKTFWTYSGDTFTITFNLKNLNPNTKYNIVFQINSNPKVQKTLEVTSDENGSCKASYRLFENEIIQEGSYSFGLKAISKTTSDTIFKGNLDVKKAIVGDNIKWMKI